MTHWDRCLSERAQEFFGEEMKCSRITGKSLNVESMTRPLSDLSDMARQSLVALTEWSTGDFQSVSDCAHLKPFVSESVRSPLYSVALLDVLSHCLHTSCEIDTFLEFRNDPEGYQQLITGLLSDLVRMLQGLDYLTEERLGIESALGPDAEHGKKFQGRRRGAVSPITARVAAYLKKNPKASAGEAWDALAKRPPNGLRFVDSKTLGPYIEDGAAEVMKWPRFRNIVSEQRPAEAKRGRRKPA